RAGSAKGGAARRCIPISSAPLSSRCQARCARKSRNRPATGLGASTSKKTPLCSEKGTPLGKDCPMALRRPVGEPRRAPRPLAANTHRLAQPAEEEVPQALGDFAFRPRELDAL